ncbi:MAG: hypothetical protein AB9835_11000 [Eubacteriales bacterium]
MSKVTTSITEYKNFGRCLCVSNGLLEILVTIDIGPRIISCHVPGCENMMFNDTDRAACEDVSSCFGDGAKWYIYGGHRLWVSPEHMPLTYYPDCEKVEYVVDGNKVTLTPPAQRVNNLQHSLELTMEEDKPVMKVRHIIENLSDYPVKGAAWALSVMAPGGTVICPQPDEDTGLLGNRILALWPYTRMTDSRALFLDKYIAVRQDTKATEKFKFGINNTKGWIAYAGYGQLLVKRYKPLHPGAEYPDYGVSTEVFTNDKFIEAETLSPLYTLGKGGRIVHDEEWTVTKADAPQFTAEGIVSFAEKIGK